jgi:mono/diheme cytochrome c family protein
MRHLMLALSFAGFATLAAEAIDPALPGKAVAILEAKCFKCHGPDKQKAKLRLDSAEALAKGGEDGPVITADKPEESPLILSVKRTDPDPDKAMPPKAKDALTEAQVAVLVAWVKAGTPWPVKAAGAATKPASGPSPAAPPSAPKAK